MPTAQSTEFSEPSVLRMVVIRVLGHMLLALLTISMPVLGEDRFLLAGFLMLIAAPAVCWIGIRFRDPAHCWIDPLCDLTVIILAAWLMPIIWTGALCLALMVALSPSVSLHPRSNVIYTCYGTLMFVGMGAAWWFRVPESTAVVNEGWVLLSIAAVYPTLLVYANWQRKRALVLLERSHLLTAVTDVSGGVAHDFNNVLMAISGHAELVSLTLTSDHPAQQSLKEVVDGTSRASLLCGQLLAFGGKGKQGRTTMSLVDEVSTIVGLLRPALPAGVAISVAPHEQKPYVYAERSELQQVLLNIIVNAGEAMANRGGVIKIAITRGEHKLRKNAIVIIEDEGAGMTGDVLNRVFDPFYTTKDRGHGLGLASVKRIMNAHAGDITITSEPDIGSTVTLTWPETSAPPSPHPQKAPTQPLTSLLGSE